MRNCQLCKEQLVRKPFASPYGGVPPDFPILLYCNNCGVYYFDRAYWCGFPDGSGRVFWGEDDTRITAAAHFIAFCTNIDKSNPDAFLVTLTGKPQADAEYEIVEIVVGAQRLDALTVALLKDVFVLTLVAVEKGAKQLVSIRFSGFPHDPPELWEIPRVTNWWYSIWKDIPFCPCLLDRETLALTYAFVCASMPESFACDVLQLRPDLTPWLSGMHPDRRKLGIVLDQSLQAFARALDKAEGKRQLARSKQEILSGARARLESAMR